ncbi:SMC4, partial [Symbiodinium microadriaticum]
MEDPSNGADKTTRLMITSMVLENFKSYAGEQEIGPFHKRFSSIVGPNGSGKSNVIDALLFVFGKRAKQLRLNKVSELIHRSSRFPDLEYAKVAVYFQLIIDDESSQDDYEVIPGSEFVVSRIAFQSNQSKYSVDGKNSTYTEVEQIAAASTAVDGLNETRLERVKRLQIAQSDKDNLEGPCKEAHEYLEKEASLRHKKNTLYQYHWQECSRNVEQLGSKLGGYQAKLKYEHDKLKETEAQLKEIEKQYAMSNAEYERLNAEMQKTADFTAYERRDTKMVEDMKYLKTQITKLNESQKEADYAQEADKIHTEIETLKIEISAIEARKEVAEAHLDEVTSSLQESTATLRVELEEADRVVSELLTEKALQTAETRLAGLKSEERDLDQLRRDTEAQQTTKNAASRAEVQSILKQARPGGVLANVAVRGRLGDLGTIPSEYDTAISTACGVLDFIVVDRAIDADACMSYLRETNIGRASFIVLEKLGLP